MSKVCRKCHFETNENIAFCPVCRSALSDSAAAKENKPKKRMPYILIGVGAAAVIFVIALIIVLNTGGKLAGTYTWTSAGEGQSGTLTISDDGTAIFTDNASNVGNMTFNTDSNTLSYINSQGTVTSGTYQLSGSKLSVTIDGYTDTFRKQ